MGPHGRRFSSFSASTIYCYLSLWLQCCLVGLVSAQTAATDGPASYQGLYLNPTGAVEPVNCGSSSVFAMIHTFAGCCSIGGNCNFPTACAHGKPTNRLGGAWTCGQDRDCYTMTVYADFPSATESWIVHNCAKSWSAHTIYRKLPASLTATATETGSSQGGAGAITAAPNIDDGEENTQDDEPETSSQPQSQAWIAGVAIGSLALGAALGGLWFWIWRRRKMRRHAGPEERRDSYNNRNNKGFALHSAKLLRSGGTYYAPVEGETKNERLAVGAVTVADGVEMEGNLLREKYRHRGSGLLSPQEVGGTMSVELDGAPAPPPPQYVRY